MSNELSAQELLPPEIGLTLLGFGKSVQGWLVRAEGRTGSECPSCGTQSTARHSRYWRQLQDLPVQGKRVALQLRLSRWRCRNRECEQAIFRERLGEVVAPWARRTSRVEEVLLLVTSKWKTARVANFIRLWDHSYRNPIEGRSDRRTTWAKNVRMFDLGQCFSIVDEGHAELRWWTARSVLCRDADSRMTERRNAPMAQIGRAAARKTAIGVLPEDLRRCLCSIEFSKSCR